MDARAAAPGKVPGEQVRALIAATERSLGSNLRLGLRLGWQDLSITVASEADEARQLIIEDPPDIVFVSSRFASLDTLQLVRQLRSLSNALVFVLGKGRSTMDTVEALEAGADEYISVPFSDSLLVARVHAALRLARREPPEGMSSITHGDLSIDPERHEVCLAGQPLNLTPIEFKLLYQLALHDGRVVTQQALEQEIWDCVDMLYVDVLRKHVQRLRRKLELHNLGQVTVVTVPRIGYKLVRNPGSRSVA